MAEFHIGDRVRHSAAKRTVSDDWYGVVQELMPERVRVRGYGDSVSDWLPGDLEPVPPQPPQPPEVRRWRAWELWESACVIKHDTELVLAAAFDRVVTERDFAQSILAQREKDVVSWERENEALKQERDAARAGGWYEKWAEVLNERDAAIAERNKAESAVLDWAERCGKAERGRDAATQKYNEAIGELAEARAVRDEWREQRDAAYKARNAAYAERDAALANSKAWEASGWIGPEALRAELTHTVWLRDEMRRERDAAQAGWGQMKRDLEEAQAARDAALHTLDAIRALMAGEDL